MIGERTCKARDRSLRVGHTKQFQLVLPEEMRRACTLVFAVGAALDHDASPPPGLDDVADIEVRSLTCQSVGTDSITT